MCCSLLTTFFYSVSLPMLLMLDYWIMRGKHNPGSGLAEDFCFGSFPGCSSCVCTVARTAAFSCRTFLLSFSPSALYWLTAASAVWLCELHVGNAKGSLWLTSLRRRKESLAGSPSPQRHRVKLCSCVAACQHMLTCVTMAVPYACMCFPVFALVFACPSVSILHSTHVISHNF